MSTRTGAKKHVHKYEHVTGKHITIWRCALSDCTHYMPRHLEDVMMDGMKSICWECGREFIMDETSLIMTRPVCQQCANPELVSAISEKLKDFGL